MRYPGCSDCEGVALAELVVGVSAFLRKKPSTAVDGGRDTNIKSYVASRVTFALKRYVRTDNLITVPYGSIHHLIKRGMYDALNVSVKSGLPVDSTSESLFSSLILRLAPRTNTSHCVLCTPETDVRDVMNKVLKTDADKRLVELKIIGCSDKEIAQEIGKSVSYIQKRRHELISLLRKELLSFKSSDGPSG
jgi:DNA-binding CsgD family transcriptional regulator